MRLEAVNGMSAREFLGVFGRVFEHSPWIAERAFSARPFRSIEDLYRAMLKAMREASKEEQFALVRAHPELAGMEANEGNLTRDSSSEQARLGFTALSRDELIRMTELNHRYRERFGFPCIVALRLHESRESVMAEMQRRSRNDADTELTNALEQIGHIARGRLAKLIEE